MGRTAANSTANSRTCRPRRAGANGWAASRRRRSPPPGRCCAKIWRGWSAPTATSISLRAIARARRAGTSRVRSVRGSRRALRAVRTGGGFRARRGRRSGSRRRANPGRAAPAARPRLLLRAVSTPPRPVVAPAAAARRRDRRRARRPWPRRTECGLFLRRRWRSSGAGRGEQRRGEQRRGEQRQRERPVQFLGENGIGEPGREEFLRAPPRSPCARARLTSSTSSRRRTAPGLDATQARAASIAAGNASSPGRSKASAARAIAERHCPADPVVSARQARSRRPAGPGSAPAE